jgi:Ran GTPase-activating protein (RanGAP) involved in mRNA processing and transport
MERKSDIQKALRKLKDSSVEEADFSRGSHNDPALSKDDLKTIFEFLRTNTTLKFVNLNHQRITVADLKILAEALIENTTLQSIDLGSNNDLGQEGAQIIAEILIKNKTLRSLKCSSNGFDPRRYIDHPSTFPLFDAVLAYFDEPGTIAIAEALKKNTVLESLDLAHNHIDLKGIKALADALKVNHTLKILVLSYNVMGPEGAYFIAEALKKNRSLEHLDIRSPYKRTYIGDDGAAVIADALIVNESLRSIDMRHNGITNVGLKYIRDALNKNQTLTQMTLIESVLDPKLIAEINDKLKRNAILRIQNKLLPKVTELVSSFASLPGFSPESILHVFPVYLTEAEKQYGVETENDKIPKFTDAEIADIVKPMIIKARAVLEGSSKSDAELKTRSEAHDAKDDAHKKPKKPR